MEYHYEPLHDPTERLKLHGLREKVRNLLGDVENTNINDLSPTYIDVVTPLNYREISEQIGTLGYSIGHQWHLSLSGLSCGKCVNKLTIALQEHPQISSFNVSKTELTLTTLLSEDEVIECVESVGYQASPYSEDAESVEDRKEANSENIPVLDASEQAHSYHLVLQGMTCASCVSSVEKALKSVAHIERVQVNLAEQTALVFSSSSRDQIEQPLLQAVKDAGYQADFVEDAQTQQETSSNDSMQNCSDRC